MKQYVFSPIDESWRVSYLTNAIATNDRLFINKIKSSYDGLVWTNGLCPEAQAIGMIGAYDEVTLTELYQKAVATQTNLRVYEDRQTGELNLNNDLDFILTFIIQGTYVATVDNYNMAIDCELPFGSVVTALTPSFTTTNGATVYIGATELKSGKNKVDLTNDVTLLVYAANGGEPREYTWSVSVAAK